MEFLLLDPLPGQDPLSPKKTLRGDTQGGRERRSAQSNQADPTPPTRARRCAK